MYVVGGYSQSNAASFQGGAPLDETLTIYHCDSEAKCPATECQNITQICEQTSIHNSI